MSKKSRNAKRDVVTTENVAELLTNPELAREFAESVDIANTPTVDLTSDADVMTAEELQAERERLIAEAKAELEAPPVAAKPERKPTVTTPTVRTPGGTAVNPNSIRQIIRTGLLAGKSTKEIEAVLKEKVPSSMAAAKAVKHIGFYRCLMRKAGELPPVKR